MSDEEQQFHIRLRRGDVGRYVLMPGDPGRVPLIAAHLEGAVEVSRNREFLTYTGSLDGVPVSVTSTGIGSPSTAIAAEELIAIGADTLIRVGTAGSIAKDLRTGDLVIAQGSVRDEGTSPAYVPIMFPAVADLTVVNALVGAARESGHRYRAGIIRSSDSFYGDVAPHTMPYTPYPLSIWERAGVLASEMEASTLFVVAWLRKVRAGAIAAVVNATEVSVDTGEVVALSLEPLIETAIDGVRRLIKLDG
ncbi:MAG TPA: nucleoside phosphorylase [Chloroflexota bacterium]|jgi:uridine phosphorylase|nr:nucleoside phosphorylase [Chloroflexota bacterium]